MLIKFAVKNYKSIKDEVAMNMLRKNGDMPAVVENTVNYFEQEINGEKYAVCPIMSLFGPNACGKSNVLKALITMRQLVLNGETANFYNPFRFSVETESAPTEFRIMFSKNNVVYDYGIIFDDKEIKHEFLNKQENGKDFCVFDTDDAKTIPQYAWSQYICSRKSMLISISQHIDENNIIRSDIENVTDFFKNDIIVADEIDSLPVVDKDIWNQIDDVTNIMMNMDMGFYKIDVDVMDKEKMLTEEFLNVAEVYEKKEKLRDKNKYCEVVFSENTLTAYNINMYYRKDDGSDIKMNLVKEESTGTRNLFRFILFLIHALKTGKIIAFDEIDRTIHTELIHYIFKMIKSADLNTKNAQLICSSHNPCAMLDLDPREILIVDKNRSLSTKVKSLISYKGVKETQYGMDIVDFYLNGDYGGIPRVREILGVREVSRVTDDF